MNNKMMGFVGVGLLVVGLFVPIATMPFLGSVTLMSNGYNGVALSLLLLAMLSGYLLWSERYSGLIWTAGASLLTVLYVFARLQWAMSLMRTNMAQELENNPFAGFAQAAMASVGMQWGWLMLVAGPAVLVYIAIQERKTAGLPNLSFGEGVDRIFAIVSILVLSLTFAQDGWRYLAGADRKAIPADSVAASPVTSQASAQPSVEEANYIMKYVRLYEFEAKYYDSLLDGRVPGVDFKIKNEGTRTINELTVQVVFFDANDKPIAEEVYYPVNVGGIGIGPEDKPLRPNYIWQQESDRFYNAERVPSEWSEGKARANVTEIKFAP